MPWSRWCLLRNTPGYSRRSYLPFEALDSGDPQAKIIAFLDKIRRTFAA
jgi:hypothetical protein